ALDYVAARHAELSAQAPHQLESRAAPRVVEARTDALLEEPRHQQVRLGAGNAGRAVRADEAVVLERVARGRRLALDRRRSGRAGPQRGAGEHVDRLVLPEQVAPPELHEPARRDFEHFGRRPAGFFLTEHAPALEPAAIAHRG